MAVKKPKKMRRIPKSFVFDEDVVEMLRDLKESLNSKSEAYAAQEAIRVAWKARFPEEEISWRDMPNFAVIAEQIFNQSWTREGDTMDGTELVSCPLCGCAVPLYLKYKHAHSHAVRGEEQVTTEEQSKKLTLGERIAFGLLILGILAVWFCIIRMP